jgi:hypothetical protein
LCRPDDPYAHAVYGNKHKSNCLLVKLTRRVRRRQQVAAPVKGQAGGGQAEPSAAQQAQQPGKSHGEEEDEFRAEAVARVQRTYRQVVQVLV